MIFVIDSKGTTKSVLYEPIYQGSLNANQIILAAPFAQSTIPYVRFVLPNGIITDPQVMSAFPNQEKMYDAEGNIYSSWYVDIDAPITEFAGIVDVSFFIPSAYGNSILTTYTSSFEVQKGMPPAVNPTPSPDVFTQIINYLSNINASTSEAIDKSISYIRYVAPSLDLINSSVESIVPTNDAAFNGSLSVDTMTSYLDEDNLRNPNAVGNREQLWYQGNSSVRPLGFSINLEEQKNVGLVQLYFYNVVGSPVVKCYAFETDESAPQNIGEITLKEGSYLDIYQFKINKPVKKIWIYQNSGVNRAFCIKGVEIYQENINGQYEIVRENGNKSYIDTYDAEMLVNIVTGIKNEAEGYKEQSKEWADIAHDKVEEITNENNYNHANGFVRLNANAKIPADLIPLDKTIEMIPITDESQLTSLYQANVGDIAYMPITTDEGTVVTKSWRLFGEQYWVKSNWILQATTYNSTSLYAEESGHSEDTTKVNGVLVRFGSKQDYDKDTKDGLYVITNYAEEV